MLFTSEIVCTIAFVAVKISILLLYRSIFPGQAFVIVINFTSAFMIAWGLALICSKPAKVTYVNNVGLQTDLEGGALIGKDGVM